MPLAHFVKIEMLKNRDVVLDQVELAIDNKQSYYLAWHRVRITDLISELMSGKACHCTAVESQDVE